MKRQAIFLFLFSLIAVSAAMAAAPRKILVAVPYFQLEGQVEQTYSNTLAETLQAAFERSGKISTKSESDIQQILKQTAESQLLGQGCKSDENCMKGLASKLQVSYIAQSRLVYLNGKYIASVRMIPFMSDREIPTLQEEIASSSDIISVVEKMATDITLMLPVEGAMLAVQGEEIYLNVGASQGIKAGDEFFTLRESVVKNKKGEIVARKRDNYGKIVIKSADDSTCVAVQSKGSGFAEGDIVLLDQSAIIKKINDERKRKEEMKEEEAEKYRAQLRAQQREDRMRAARTWVRLGAGQSRMSDSDLNTFYGKGLSFMIDVIPQSTQYVDVYFRGVFKYYTMSDNFASLSGDSSKPDVVSKGTNLQFALDGGVQLKLLQGYFLYELWTLYIPLGLRMLYYSESAQNKLSNSFLSFGIVGGAGLQVTLTPNMGIYGEASYGYTPVGGGLANSSSSSSSTSTSSSSSSSTTPKYNSANVEGFQWFAGIILRF